VAFVLQLRELVAHFLVGDDDSPGVVDASELTGAELTARLDREGVTLAEFEQWSSWQPGRSSDVSEQLHKTSLCMST
jgi:hypothetical protein